ncbi:hypothetical protein IA57_05810 [Mangrovimonas yunxiaonensis]|uniref:Uncharacterized protein n=1 Tax=Mangrovimonas yunxiaonensis TaxID=1197477 RepID=A0A084TKV6_9FLAO|nr:DUF5694 domain-containing protein [Mangrovimonas yunxiaonensis]KFB01342.1 hypothetical protein IA57_05810 [Mangrovimonas yunxiaonensis]GGH37257.1 hypothetical protein GCM10011364_05100 [Mangrovimonas yunxiaonensis]
MKPIFLILCIVIFSCNTKNKPNELKTESPTEQKNDKIKVLNFGTFHFGYTPDANKTEFDEHSEEAQKEIREISKMLAQFKPTIICIENLPKFNNEINKAYQDFLDNPSTLNTNYGESSMIGFDVGRLSNVKKIYGIDNHMGYNYSVGDFIENNPELENSIDSKTYLQLTNEPFKEYPEIAKREAKYDELSLLEKLKLSNEPIHLDYAINTNADKLLYVGIDDGFEGADNAAIFYHRNMKIFSNLNRIPMTKNDRVFIIMGTAHTAFLREFMRRSPKFEMVNTLEYLN